MLPLGARYFFLVDGEAGTGLGTWFRWALIRHTSVCQMLLAPFPDSRLRHRSTVNWLAQWHSFFSGRGRVQTWIYVLIPLSFSVAFLRVGGGAPPVSMWQDPPISGTPQASLLSAPLTHSSQGWGWQLDGEGRLTSWEKELGVPVHSLLVWGLHPLLPQITQGSLWWSSSACSWVVCMFNSGDTARVSHTLKFY